MTNLPIKFEVSSVTRYGDMKDTKNAQKWGWLRVVRSHPGSSAMSPFDRAHTISYSSLIETMRLSCTVFEIERVICRNSPTSTYLTCIWRPRWGWPCLNFEKIFGIRKLESLLCDDPMCTLCSRFDTIPDCDREGQTYTRRQPIPR